MILRGAVAGAAAVMLIGAGFVWVHGRARATDPVPQLASSSAPSVSGSEADALPALPPTASEKTREEKRFDRYDHDRNGAVSREEYLAARRKAFARLDTNGDGQLSFDEWAAKSEAKFASADADKSGTLTRPEFATTRVVRKTSRRTPDCPPLHEERGDSED